MIYLNNTTEVQEIFIPRMVELLEIKDEEIIEIKEEEL